MKNILAENMRRFRTKNLTEQEEKTPEGNVTPDPNTTDSGAAGYYYKKGEEHSKGPFRGIDMFPFSNPAGNGVNTCYDVMGKPIVRVEQNAIVNFDNITAPKVPTTWFMTWNAPGDDKIKIVGYHPTLGIITEPGTTKVLMRPGKNLDDAAVYNWLFKQSGIRGNDILVGIRQREQGAF